MAFTHHHLRNQQIHTFIQIQVTTFVLLRIASDSVHEARTAMRLHKSIKLHELLLCALLLFIIVCGLSITSGTGVYFNSINQCLCYARINDDVFLHETRLNGLSFIF